MKKYNWIYELLMTVIAVGVISVVVENYNDVDTRLWMGITFGVGAYRVIDYIINNEIYHS